MYHKAVVDSDHLTNVKMTFGEKGPLAHDSFSLRLKNFDQMNIFCPFRIKGMQIVQKLVCVFIILSKLKHMNNNLLYLLVHFAGAYIVFMNILLFVIVISFYF